MFAVSRPLLAAASPVAARCVVLAAAAVRRPLLAPARYFESHPDSTTILGVGIRDRAQNAPAVNETLTSFGTTIRTRLGLSRARGQHGLILLEVYGDRSRGEEIRTKLDALPGVTAKSMEFEFFE